MSDGVAVHGTAVVAPRRGRVRVVAGAVATVTAVAGVVGAAVGATVLGAVLLDLGWLSPGDGALLAATWGGGVGAVAGVVVGVPIAFGFLREAPLWRIAAWGAAGTLAGALPAVALDVLDPAWTGIAGFVAGLGALRVRLWSARRRGAA